MLNWFKHADLNAISTISQNQEKGQSNGSIAINLNTFWPIYLLVVFFYFAGLESGKQWRTTNQRPSARFDHISITEDWEKYEDFYHDELNTKKADKVRAKWIIFIFLVRKIGLCSRGELLLDSAPFLSFSLAVPTRQKTKQKGK